MVRWDLSLLCGAQYPLSLSVGTEDATGLGLYRSCLTSPQAQNSQKKLIYYGLVWAQKALKYESFEPWGRCGWLMVYFGSEVL